MTIDDLKKELETYRTALKRIAIHADAWNEVEQDSGLALLVRKEVNKVVPDFPGGDWANDAAGSA